MWPFTSTSCYYSRNISLLIQPSVWTCSVLPPEVNSVLRVFTGAKEDITGGPFSVFSSVWAGHDSDLMLICVNSCQCATFGTRRCETGWLWGGWTADRHTNQEKHLCWDSILDGTRGHQTVCLWLQGELGAGGLLLGATLYKMMLGLIQRLEVFLIARMILSCYGSGSVGEVCLLDLKHVTWFNVISPSAVLELHAPMLQSCSLLFCAVSILALLSGRHLVPWNYSHWTSKGRASKFRLASYEGSLPDPKK